MGLKTNGKGLLSKRRFVPNSKLGASMFKGEGGDKKHEEIPNVISFAKYGVEYKVIYEMLDQLRKVLGQECMPGILRKIPIDRREQVLLLMSLLSLSTLLLTLSEALCKKVC